MSIIAYLVSFLKSDQLLESPITNSSCDFAVASSSTLIDEAMGFFATLFSTLFLSACQAFFGMFVILIILATLYTYSTFLHAILSSSPAEVLPSHQQDAQDRSDYLPLLVATPRQIQPANVSRQPLRQSPGAPFAIPFGLSRTIPVPSSSFSTPSAPIPIPVPNSSRPLTNPFANIPSTPTSPSSPMGIEESFSSLSINCVDVDSVVDSLSTLSISRPDIDSVISSFNSLSILPTAADQPQTKPTRTKRTIPRPIIANQKVRRFTPSIFEPPSNIDHAFSSLSITPRLKSCLKRPHLRLPKKVHFGNDSLTYAEIRYYDAEDHDPVPGHEELEAALAERLSTLDHWKRLNSKSCTPHHRASKVYCHPANDDSKLFIRRIDGEYEEPKYVGRWVDKDYGVEGGHLRRNLCRARGVWCCGEGASRERAQQQIISERVRMAGVKKARRVFT